MIVVNLEVIAADESRHAALAWRTAVVSGADQQRAYTDTWRRVIEPGWRTLSA